MAHCSKIHESSASRANVTSLNPSFFRVHVKKRRIKEGVIELKDHSNLCT